MKAIQVPKKYKDNLKLNIESLKDSIDWDTIKGDIIFPTYAGKFYEVVFNSDGEVIDIISERTVKIHYKL